MFIIEFIPGNFLADLLLAVPNLLAVLIFPLCWSIGFYHGCVFAVDHDGKCSEETPMEFKIWETNVCRRSKQTLLTSHVCLLFRAAIILSANHMPSKVTSGRQLFTIGRFKYKVAGIRKKLFYIYFCRRTKICNLLLNKNKLFMKAKKYEIFK